MSALVEQQRASAGRVFKVLTATHANPPTDPTWVPAVGLTPASTTPATTPDVTTSPLRADGSAPCSGLMFMLKNPSIGVFYGALPEAPEGFIVTVYVRNPVTDQWGSTGEIQIPYDEWWRTFDFNGGDLYFQIGGVAVPPVGAVGINRPSAVDVHLVEL
jgi:hypothetical protein